MFYYLGSTCKCMGDLHILGIIEAMADTVWILEWDSYSIPPCRIYANSRSIQLYLVPIHTAESQLVKTSHRQQNK